MCVCMYMYVIYMCICVHDAWVWLYVCMFICMYICMCRLPVCLCAVLVLVSVCACVFVCVCVPMHICVSVCNLVFSVIVHIFCEPKLKLVNQLCCLGVCGCCSPRFTQAVPHSYHLKHHAGFLTGHPRSEIFRGTWENKLPPLVPQPPLLLHFHAVSSVHCGLRGQHSKVCSQDGGKP